MSINRLTRPRVEPDPAVLDRLRDQANPIAPHIQATLGHHPELFAAQTVLFGAVLRKGRTSRRHRELAILRMGWNCQAEYEFGQHTLMGRAAGVTDEEIYALTRPLDEFDWAADDRCLLRMVDELFADDMVSDPTWAELVAHWSVPEILELLGASLTYRMVSGLLNTLGVQLEDGVPGWPPAPTG